MKQFLSFWLSLSMLTSCAKLETVQDPYRRISSIDSQINTLDPQEVQQDIRDKYKGLEFITLAAYENLAQFDEFLNTNGGPLEDNPHYAGLLVARAQMEELHHAIIEQRTELYQAAFNTELALEDRLKSIELIHLSIPDAQTNLNVLLFRRLHENFSAFSRQLLLDLAKVEEKALRKSFENLYATLMKHIDPFHERKTALIEWRSLTAKARLALKENPEWLVARRNYQHEAQEMRLALRDMRRVKATDLQFYPSSTAAGNVTGAEFPAKVWALTFDGGPGEEASKQILENLQSHDLKATFFQVAGELQKHAKAGREIREAGMDIGAHSYSHRKLSQLTSEQRDWEIASAAQDIGNFHQQEMRLFRLPYGAGLNNSDIRERIAKAKLINVHWTVDALDWLEQAPEEISLRVLKQMRQSHQDAGIILFHDSHERTVAASEEIMRHLKKDNRRSCSVQEIVAAMNAKAAPCARTEISSR